MKAKEYQAKYLELMKANGNDIANALVDITKMFVEETWQLIKMRGVKKMGGIQSAILESHRKWIAFAEIDKVIPDTLFLTTFKLVQPTVWEILLEYETKFPHHTPDAMKVTTKIKEN